MNISYNWLKEYLNFNLSPEEVSAALTSIGLETDGVEKVETIKGGLEGLVVGKVLTCVEHPDSDHLHITTVDLGDGIPTQIVCGAANVAAGQHVVVATVGTKLYDGDKEFAIKKSETVFTIFEEEHPFVVTWSHYLQLMRIENEDERSFYEIEAAREKWGVRDLSRQYNSSLYERLALSMDKDKVQRLSQEGNVITTSKDVLKDPYVLEFVGLEDKYNYSETDLENRLLDNLQQFLLELGKGFTFVARQKRFSFEEDHFRVDLVFYNRLLKCFVLFDLKIGKLKHQDLGQMQMYVNYYDRYEKTEEENPTIGVLLCNVKNDAMVELTLPEDSNIYASQYKLYLPDKKLLQDKLKEWLQEEGGAEDEI